MGKLRKVTVALKEQVAHWARLEAARQGISVSRLIAGMLKERMLEGSRYERAMRRALARAPFLKSDGVYPAREDTHDRDDLR